MLTFWQDTVHPRGDIGFLFVCLCMSVILHTRGRNSCPIFMKFEPQIGIRISRSPIDFKVKLHLEVKFLKSFFIPLT